MSISALESPPAPSTDQPAPPDKFAFLQDLTSSKRHTGKPFYQHLFNVYTYLKGHNLPEEVCDAGLFHSIYGTEFYDFHHDRITRDVVRGLIGEYAEELVHIFCTTKDRINAITNNTMGFDAKRARDLCLIEFANLRDQNTRARYQDKLVLLAEAITRLEREHEGEREVV